MVTLVEYEVPMHIPTNASWVTSITGLLPTLQVLNWIKNLSSSKYKNYNKTKYFKTTFVAKSSLTV